MAVTVDQLKQVMKFHLSNFNDEGVTISDDTIHNTVLSDSDSLTPQTSSMNVYRGLIIWTLSKNGQAIKPWPNDWMESSVADLAQNLI